MSKITMYDMGFGDAHILEREGYDEKLLVDFGSYNPSTAFAYASDVPTIVNEIQNSPRASFLLTHFHMDHYNMLPFLPQLVFDRIFIRNIYAKKRTVYMNALALLAYQKKSIKWQNAYMSLLLTPTLFFQLKNHGHFCFVRKDSRFWLNGEKYEIFRPDLNSIEEDFEPIQLESPNANEFIVQISELGNQLKQIIDRNKHFNQETKMDEFSRHFEERTIIVKKEDGIREDRTERFYSDDERSIDQIRQDLIRILDDEMPQISKVDKDKIKKLLKRNDEHKYNIIFGLNDCNDPKKCRLLMCGDANRKDVKSVIKDNKFNSIEVYKAPHHGTKTHCPLLSGIVINNVLIPYSQPFHNYTISNEYSDTTIYKQKYQPKKSLNY